MADEKLVAKMHSASAVWQWFGSAQSNISQSKVVCKLCQVKVDTSQDNTTNLFNHL